MPPKNYRIHASYLYHAGTREAPKNGPLCAEGERLEFPTREAAAEYITGKLGCINYGGGYYSPSGMYRTRNGEYARPVYLIRKIA